MNFKRIEILHQYCLLFTFSFLIIRPFKSLGIILKSTSAEVILWHTCLLMGTLTSGIYTKDRVWPDLQSHEVWSLFALSFTKVLSHGCEFTPLSHSPCLCTMIPRIWSFHIFPLGLFFTSFVLNLLFRQRLD